MRKYQPIWITIAKHKTASLIAPPSTHSKIINAVRKEKCRDVGWKYLLLEKGTKYILVEKSIGNRLTFKLKKDEHYERKSNL